MSFFFFFILVTNEEALLVNVDETNELISFDSEYLTPASFPTNNPLDNQTNNVKNEKNEIFGIVFK